MKKRKSSKSVDVEKETQQEVEEQQENEETVSARKELLIFWARMIGWFGAGVIAPISVFSIKFGLFDTYGYQVTTDELGNVTGMHVALNGWGIVSVLLIAFTLLSVINEIIDAHSRTYSYSKQILTGLKTRIVPLAIVAGICWFLKGCIDQVLFCTITIGISQIVAIALNPLPAWKAKKKGEEDYSDILTYLPKYLKSKLKKEDKK